MKTKEEIAEYKAKWQKDNSERMKEVRKQYVLRNPKKVTEQIKYWEDKNPDQGGFKQAKYRAKLLKAQPNWAKEKEIREFYKQAKQLKKDTGVAHVVDHIIPLNSDLVCGLHWEGNLQVITHRENLIKRSTF